MHKVNVLIGFGGTNAHAILESYQPTIALSSEPLAEEMPLIPFVFSAASEKSLEGVITSYFSYLQENQSIDLRRLAYTLVCGTSLFPLLCTTPAVGLTRRF
jgi:hybrid polyketide synthase/nonribosomal peptide synthetase ACE1